MTKGLAVDLKQQFGRDFITLLILGKTLNWSFVYKVAAGFGRELQYNHQLKGIPRSATQERVFPFFIVKLVRVNLETYVGFCV